MAKTSKGKVKHFTYIWFDDTEKYTKFKKLCQKLKMDYTGFITRAVEKHIERLSNNDNL